MYHSQIITKTINDPWELPHQQAQPLSWTLCLLHPPCLCLDPSKEGMSDERILRTFSWELWRIIEGSLGYSGILMVFIDGS